MAIKTEWGPIACGAAGGAMGVLLLGFLVFGWVPAGTAKETANTEAKAAVLAALTPICVSRFNSDASAAALLVQLKDTTNFNQGPFIEKGGWATMPGSEAPVAGLAKKCADQLAAS